RVIVPLVRTKDKDAELFHPPDVPRQLFPRMSLRSTCTAKCHMRTPFTTSAREKPQPSYARNEARDAHREKHSSQRTYSQLALMVKNQAFSIVSGFPHSAFIS
ncbi:unnamed protein product, partial [Ectocarpus fasciculatus]